MTQQFVEFTALEMAMRNDPEDEIVQFLRDHFFEGELSQFHLAVDRLYEAIGKDFHRRKMLQAAQLVNASSERRSGNA